ncbi:hypothetical protein HPB47_023568, partial [Ixodes persulcatus]
LAASIKDILLRLTPNMQGLRGHCFDGAANMSGRLHGRVLQTQEEILNTPAAVADGRKAALVGVSKGMKKFETMFFLTTAVKIFRP